MTSRHSFRLLLLLVLVAVVFVQPMTAAAVPPPIPSSFYGVITLNGAPVPSGTPIQAVIGGKVYAEFQTTTYQGQSVYTVEVPGDMVDTAAKEGGVDGETVSFRVANFAAAQTGVWRSGLNQPLDLTATRRYLVALPLVRSRK